MIFTSMKSVYLLGVLFAFRMLVVVGCRISDDEETTTNKPAYVTATVKQREPTPGSPVAHSGKTTAAAKFFAIA